MTEGTTGRAETPRMDLALTDQRSRVSFDEASRRQIRSRRLRREREMAARRRLLLAVGAASTGRWSRM
jgi:hypothetical protein